MYAHTGVATRHLVFPAEVVRDVLEGTRTSGSVFLPSGKPDDRGPTTAQRMQHYAADAPPLAVAASCRALEEAQVRAETISHLVTVSCTGFAAPGVDLSLIHGLGLPATVQRCNVGFMGCHGAINGLRVASAFTTAGPSARVLLCAVELCSLHYFYGWAPQQVIANALFADGAHAQRSLLTQRSHFYRFSPWHLAYSSPAAPFGTQDATYSERNGSMDCATVAREGAPTRYSHRRRRNDGPRPQLSCDAQPCPQGRPHHP
jgi:predicted naringenin-chalcone synthase